MTKFKITKWIGSKIIEIAGMLLTIIGIVVPIILAVISLGGTMNTLIGCATNDIVCLGINGSGFVVGITLAFLTAIILVSASADITILVSATSFSKILNWAKTPKAQELHIIPGELYDDIYTLSFRSTEWRYLFNKTNAFVTIPSMFRITILENLEWRNTQKTEPIMIKR